MSGGVPIRFKKQLAGLLQRRGSVRLAGPGRPRHYSNDYCYAESALLGGVMGPLGGAPKPEMPPEWHRPDPMFPSPGSAYATVPPGTNGEVEIADVVRFQRARPGRPSWPQSQTEQFRQSHHAAAINGRMSTSVPMR